MNKILFIIAAILIILFVSSNSNLQIEKKKFVVVIDAGHGGKDPGAIGLSKVYEKNLNLAIAMKLKNLLDNKYDDIEVVMTRTSDEFIELKDRGKIANEKNGDLFVSIHCNYKKTEDVDKNGFEIYISDLSRLTESEYYTKYQNRIFNTDNKDTNSTEWKTWTSLLVPLYQNIYQRLSERFAVISELEMTKNTILLSRGVNQEAFFVLVGASMPVVLIECGFLSNEGDENYLKSEKGQDEIAKSIYKAIIYFKMDREIEKIKL